MSEVRASYTDSFAHTFDPKGRITVPAEWREEPFEKNLIVFPTDQKCLRVYPASWVGRMQAKFDDSVTIDPRRQELEELMSTAQSAALDAQGRIVIKARLREAAGIPDKSTVMFVGRLDHFQMWEESEWKRRVAKPVTFEQTMRAIGQ